MLYKYGKQTRDFWGILFFHASHNALRLGGKQKCLLILVACDSATYEHGET